MAKNKNGGAGELAQAVKARRAQLGLAQGDLASRGGPGVVVVGQIERGQQDNPQPLTLGRLDTALEWPPGTAAGILHGQGTSERLEGSEVDVMQAIRNDGRLLPEAKSHLLNQYQLLLRVAAADDKTVPTPEDATADILELPHVARKRRPEPRKRQT